MKTYRYILLAILSAAIGLMTSCSPKEIYQPGAADTGAQIYFPNDVTTSINLNEADKIAIIKVKRLDATKTVEVDLLSDMSGIAENEQALFRIPEKIKFEVGKKEADIIIAFDRAKLTEGQTYPISLFINDEDNVTSYGNRAITLNLTPWPWSVIGVGKYRDGFLSSLLSDTNIGAEIDVKIYKHKSQQGVFMAENLFDWTYLTTVLGNTQQDLSGLFEYQPRNIVFKCAEDNTVSIPLQETGIIANAVNLGMLKIASYRQLPGSFEDGVITFPKNAIACLGDGGKQFQLNTQGLFRILMPGAEVTDYSLGVEYDGMKLENDNQTHLMLINFAYGDDVTAIKYILAPGEKKDNKDLVDALLKDTDNRINIVPEFVPGSKNTILGIGEKESGIYTFAAIAYDKNGEPVKKSANLFQFYYPASTSGKIEECNVTVSLHKVSTYSFPGIAEDKKNELIAKYPDYNCMVLEIRGSKIIENSMRFSLYETNRLQELLQEGVSLKDIVTNEKNSQALPTAVVEKINKDGIYYTFLTNMRSDTKHTAIIYASNIYAKDKVATSAPCVTAPVPYSGELQIGKYTITSDRRADMGLVFSNTFKVSPTLVENKFEVCPLGWNVADEAIFNAIYDPNAHTLTLDGTLAYDKNPTNIFSKLQFKLSNTEGIGWLSFDALDKDGAIPDPKECNKPCVFTVDPLTHELKALKTHLYVFKGELATGNIIGYFTGFDPEKTILEPGEAKKQPTSKNYRTLAECAEQLCSIGRTRMAPFSIVESPEYKINTSEADSYMVKIYKPKHNESFTLRERFAL